MNNQKAVEMLKIFIVVKTGSTFLARIPLIFTICSNYFSTMFVNENKIPPAAPLADGRGGLARRHRQGGQGGRHRAGGEEGR